jgi:hypothetical protein
MAVSPLHWHGETNEGLAGGRIGLRAGADGIHLYCTRPAQIYITPSSRTRPPAFHSSSVALQQNFDDATMFPLRAAAVGPDIWSENVGRSFVSRSLSGPLKTFMRLAGPGTIASKSCAWP